MIIYTYTDEAPALATYSLYPIIKHFLEKASIDITTADISLAGRILANFPEYLNEDQKVKDYLQILGELTKKSDANIIKLPNISASLPQLLDCIKELQDKGFKVPNYPNEPKDEKERLIKERYAKILGSAVNPVLREGNSIRRAAGAVKEYAKANPHSNGVWNKNTKTKVCYMDGGDFYSNEKSKIFENSTNLEVEFIPKNGDKKLLKELNIQAGEVVDATFMSAKKLDEFIAKSIDLAKDESLLYSVHLKATMMKVSDPVIFGHFVKGFFDEVFTEFQGELKALGVNPNNGLGDLFIKIENSKLKDKILAKFDEIYASRPSLSMVNSDKGITNLHVPSDVIIDASMPAMLRNSGRLWDKDAKEVEALAVIPDKSYAVVYEAMIKDLKENGTLDPSQIGSVTNIGLMAKKAEEYGSHDKTFIIESDGQIIVNDSNGEEIFRFEVEKGDIFRMTQTKSEPIKNWVKLAFDRAKLTGEKAIFWLDEKRAHDRNLIMLVKDELKKYDLKGFDYEILDPFSATLKTNQTIREGKNIISVTGNVLRDYLTDLYPILELGTSAKMLSIVPLLNGGGMFETGAGGSAPKHVEQLVSENHLRWDSLGEFMALIVSLEHLGTQNAKILAKALDKAVSRFLKEDKSPKRRAGEPDNRNSHFYLAMYFADELTKTELGNIYSDLALNLKNNEAKINDELLSVQGKSVDLGGYYKFDDEKASLVMRPSKTLNDIIN
ncbi:NADP-dependent isocitrate dehydrogenase [Campylobacter corcagiensis]|uniref:Isocitrate dehydrogenase [NADP] n=1 Tax=Campylobacter corcagiensis TaxID=1448857 RepID=A0A7M1LFL5_9BACT|nr:NADP-dependent isocitrate dehydrogenase [Campylobacter corcagiensis]QKF64618.1 isocitrate dehydrogenase, monomeric [Campylobacter corcagiensis]QOQ87210.1 NADP-dependent isocitrate dehydrogenase [Campylobacter corcagiensis]7Y1U_A Chain A, Isocitrate dehydrogenase [NADP] [Campylobacter corcagiensis]